MHRRAIIFSNRKCRFSSFSIAKSPVPKRSPAMPCSSTYSVIGCPYSRPTSGLSPHRSSLVNFGLQATAAVTVTAVGALHAIIRLSHGNQRLDLRLIGDRFSERGSTTPIDLRGLCACRQMANVYLCRRNDIRMTPLNFVCVRRVVTF